MKEHLKDIEKILDVLNKTVDLSDAELDSDEFVSRVVKPFTSKYIGTFGWDSGASKGVLIFENLGFVIKIPFTSSAEESFYGADCDQEWNYCQAEENRYLDAIDEGVSDCFAETRYIGEIDGYPIYAQKYAYIYSQNEEGSYSTREQSEKVEELCNKNGYKCFNSYWLSDLFNYFGEQVFYKFLAFLNDYNIYDLHTGNYGYIGAKPVLVDYSSWNN